METTKIKIANDVSVDVGTTVYDAGMKSIPARIIKSNSKYGHKNYVTCEPDFGAIRSNLYLYRADAIIARIKDKQKAVDRVSKTIKNLNAEITKLNQMYAAQVKATG